MPPWVIPVSFIGLVIVIVIIAAVVTNIREKKRTEAFRQVASDLSFEFLPEGSAEFLSSVGGFHLFGQGHSRKMRNLMRGSTGEIELDIFDYRYTTGSGKHQQTWQQSVFAARRAGLNLPKFAMRPETFWHRVGQWLGMQDIDFDTHPKFSKAYVLKGPDETAIREVFRPDVLDYFEERPGLNVEGEGDLLLFFRTNKRLDPEKVRDFMAEGFAVLKLFEAAEPGLKR